MKRFTSEEVEHFPADMEGFTSVKVEQFSGWLMVLIGGSSTKGEVERFASGGVAQFSADMEGFTMVLMAGFSPEGGGEQFSVPIVVVGGISEKFIRGILMGIVFKEWDISTCSTG